MDIDELVSRLVAMKNDYGNCKVEVRNPAGDFDDVSLVSATHHGRPDATRYVVFIEA